MPGFYLAITMLYYYYLPCLKPDNGVMGGLIYTTSPVKNGDTFDYWDYPVVVTDAPLCELRKTPDMNALPLLKVKPYY
jgi:hypothetical protein